MVTPCCSLADGFPCRRPHSNMSLSTSAKFTQSCVHGFLRRLVHIFAADPHDPRCSALRVACLLLNYCTQGEEAIRKMPSPISKDMQILILCGAVHKRIEKNEKQIWPAVQFSQDMHYLSDGRKTKTPNGKPTTGKRRQTSTNTTPAK